MAMLSPRLSDIGPGRSPLGEWHHPATQPPTPEHSIIPRLLSVLNHLVPSITRCFQVAIDSAFPKSFCVVLVSYLFAPSAMPLFPSCSFPLASKTCLPFRSWWWMHSLTMFLLISPPWTAGWYLQFCECSSFVPRTPHYPLCLADLYLGWLSTHFHL